MIVQKEFLSKIKDFGLNSYEAKLWTALLSRGISTAGELSDIANVPRSRTYDVLESLEKKGFIVMKLGKPIKYIAVRPSEVVERVKKKILEDAERHSKMIDSLKTSDAIEELNVLYSKGIDMVDPVELTAFLKGRKNITNHLETMIKKAQKTIIIATSNEGLKRKAKIISSHAGKKVDIKIITPEKTEVKELDNTAKIKTSKELKSRFCIIDDSEVLFMLVDDNTHPSFDTGVWINSSFTVRPVKALFESYWKTLK